jgi:hypothetical protein
VALVSALAIIVAGRFAKSPSELPDPNAGRIVFEADALGHLRRVKAPSESGRALPRLWKPEVGFMLANASSLRLDSRHRILIAAQNAGWLMEKNRLEREISRVTSGAIAPLQKLPSQNMSAVEVTENLKDYSQLSRKYDERRANYWRQSLSVLTAGQQESLAKIEETARRTK